jgi:uncharacterized cupredoxin-like copper-binding protein
MTRTLLPAAIAAMALAALACGGASASASTSPPTPAPTPRTISVTESEFKILMDSTSLEPGAYVFQVRNAGGQPHDLHIATPDGRDLASSGQLAAGQSGTFQVVLKPGIYIVYSAGPGQRGRAMEGTLTVQ